MARHEIQEERWAGAPPRYIVICSCNAQYGSSSPDDARRAWREHADYRREQEEKEKTNG